MDWKNTAIAAVVSLLFLLQGISTWRRAGTSTYRRWLGVLTILLAFLGVSAHFLLASGAMVFGLEFGIVMVQGTAAWAALVIVLVGLPISAALGVHVSRSVTGHPPPWAWPLIAGGLVGIAAVTRVQQLKAAVDLIAPIRAYDIWWPVLPVWIGMCFVWSVLLIAKVQRRSVKILVATVLGLGFSLWAVGRNQLGLHYADPMSAGLWNATLSFGLPVLMGTTAWIAFSASQRLQRIGRWWRVGIASVAAILGLISSSQWLGGEILPLLLRPWFLWVAASAVSAVLWILSLSQRWKAGELRLPDVGKKGRWDDAVAVCAILAIAVGLADGLYFMQGTPVWDLVAALVGWAIFVEVVSVGPLADFVNRPLQHSLQSAKKSIQTDWARVRELAMTSLKALADGVKSFFTFSSVGVGVLRFVILAAVLVAIAELPNAGKTVIVPFTELGLSDAEAKHFGRMLSNRVVNRFATLARELEPEVAIVRPGGDKSKRQSLNLVASGDTADRPEAVVSGDLEFGTVKIPISLITSWIQTPMRTLLGVRVVTGSVQKEGGGYLLLAQSSDGGTFRVAVPGPTVQGAAVKKEGDGDKPLTDNPALDRTIAANSLADELAYKLISTVPEMANAGMTQAWQAVDPYSKGLEKWKQFQTGRDFDALTDAIVFFRRAVQLDPNFALAHHRLGLALTADNQPFVATDALRKSLQANRNFALGYHALASHLYFNRSTDLTPSESPTVDQGAADKTQAQLLWHQLLQFPQGQVPVLAQADAHAGLCRLIFEAPGFDESDQPDAEYIRHYIAYFHCHRALQLFATLPATVRDTPDVRTAEGWAWFMAGWILNESTQTPYDVADESWLCSKDALVIDEDGAITSRTLKQSPYTNDAVKYYDRASALLPDDNTMLCTRAEAAFVRDNKNPMQAMDQSSEAHRLLAEALVGMQTAGPVKLALEEYQKAFDLDPQNLFARNGYAYAVWSWYLTAGRDSMSQLPDETVQRAEEHARHAARLAVGAVDRADAASMRSTLGEVLMLQGRWHEAYGELEAAELLAPKHPFFDEIRWELGLAYLCAGAMDRRPGRSTSAEMDFDAKAAELFTAIRARNEGREIASLNNYQPIEHHIAAGMCHSDPSGEPRSDEVETVAMPYELMRPVPRMDGYAPCTYLTVTALVVNANADEAQDLRLRVIGPGLGAAGGRVAPNQVLTLPWKDTHDQYFAQLGHETEDGFSPASGVYPIATVAKAPCSGNRIVMEFGARSAKPVGGAKN